LELGERALRIRKKMKKRKQEIEKTIWARIYWKKTAEQSELKECESEQDW
jgi:hypothetical protein